MKILMKVCSWLLKRAADRRERDMRTKRKAALLRLDDENIGKPLGSMRISGSPISTIGTWAQRIDGTAKSVSEDEQFKTFKAEKDVEQAKWLARQIRVRGSLG